MANGFILLKKCATASVLGISVLSLLSACADPYVVSEVNGNETSLTCEELNNELKLAKEYQVKAHEQDHFRSSYLLVAPGLVSAARIVRAENAAKNREKYVSSVMDAKNCARPDRLPTKM